MKLKKENIIQLLFCYNLILINDFVSSSISIVNFRAKIKEKKYFK